jgi:hypothetical protein
MRLERGGGERGVSLLAAVFFLVIVAFMGTTMVSLMGTQSATSAGESTSTQALYIAEGGGEFAQRALAQNLNWYRSATDPIVTPGTALGAGSFTVSTYLPATLLRRRVTPASPNVPVFTTDRFPAAGFIQIDDITGSGEFVQYTGVTGNTFTGITRDVTIGGVSAGAAGTFSRGTHVYPVTTLATGLLSLGACGPTSAAAFNVAAHPKLLSAGTITIDTEDISYTGSTTAGGVTTLTGITRCMNGTSSAHAVGDPVIPVLNDGTAPDYEALLVSTGTVSGMPLGSAARVVQRTIQR